MEQFERDVVVQALGEIRDAARQLSKFSARQAAMAERIGQAEEGIARALGLEDRVAQLERQRLVQTTESRLWSRLRKGAIAAISLLASLGIWEVVKGWLGGDGTSGGP